MYSVEYICTEYRWSQYLAAALSDAAKNQGTVCPCMLQLLIACDHVLQGCCRRITPEFAFDDL